MIAGVITVPSRKTALEELRSLIEPSVDRFEVFTDEFRQGHWFNYARCMTAMLDKAGKDEPVLILTDDATTVPDWRDNWERIHKRAQNNIYVLFNRQRHLFNAQNITRGYVTGCQLRGYYDQATIFINQQGLMTNVLNWFHSEGYLHPRVYKRQKHLDVVVQEYLITHNMPWTMTIPTLFDHKPIKSTLGHDVGASPLYIGNL